MMHTPLNPSNIPSAAFLGNRYPENMVIITIHKGTIAPIIAPKPLEIYFTAHVLNELLSIKFNALKINMVTHSFPFGQGCFFITK